MISNHNFIIDVIRLKNHGMRFLETSNFVNFWRNDVLSKSREWVIEYHCNVDLSALWRDKKKHKTLFLSCVLGNRKTVCCRVFLAFQLLFAGVCSVVVMHQLPYWIMWNVQYNVENVDGALGMSWSKVFLLWTFEVVRYLIKFAKWMICSLFYLAFPSPPPVVADSWQVQFQESCIGNSEISCFLFICFGKLEN